MILTSPEQREQARVVLSMATRQLKAATRDLSITDSQFRKILETYLMASTAYYWHEYDALERKQR